MTRFILMAPVARTPSFALITDAYMRTFGATRQDFGKLCVAQRQNARRNPLALLRDDMSLSQYLAARPVAQPLHLYDCVMPCAGGDGFLVMRGDRAASLGLRGVSVLGAIERHNAFPDDPCSFAAAGLWTAMLCGHRRGSGQVTLMWCRPTTTTR